MVTIENIKFNELDLDALVLKAIEKDMGFDTPSQIQQQAIPHILEGYDLIGQAQTGTGKTLAFGAPILSNMEVEKGVIKGIILAPTRELAIQVNDEMKRLSKHKKVRPMVVFGGQSIELQIRDLKKGAEIVVGTPGRVLDLLRRRKLDLSQVEYLVIDEADEMFNMGFIEDVEEIINNCADERQTLLFSATMTEKVKKIAKKYMKADRKIVTIEKKTLTVNSVSQHYVVVNNKIRVDSLCRILDAEEPDATMIFCRTKRGVDELVENMQARGYNVEGMHGDMSQNHRMNTLRKFKEGSLQFLVATDVAARGIDVENVTHVINYDLPQDVESYVHRIGRTGRANRTGSAYTLITSREFGGLREIEKATKCIIQKREVPTLKEIFQTKNKALLNQTKAILDGDTYKNFLPFVESFEGYAPEQVAAALMNLVYNKEVSYDCFAEDDVKEIKGKDFERVFISVGKNEKVNPKKILEFLTENANLNKRDVGDIDIMQKFSFIDIKSDKVKTTVKKCANKKLCGVKVRFEVASRKAI